VGGIEQRERQLAAGIEHRMSQPFDRTCRRAQVESLRAGSQNPESRRKAIVESLRAGSQNPESRRKAIKIEFLSTTYCHLSSDL
jgi:hypothetical protein